MLLFWALAGLALLQFAFAAERTKDVDDAGGDSTTRIGFSGSWKAGQDCGGCFVQPSRESAFGGTWRDATYTPGDTVPTVTVEFEGTGISVFCILANQVEWTDTLANYAFTIDGRASGSPFVHAAEDTPDYQYNVRVFSVAGLSNGKHTFVLTPRGSSSVLILFDYVTITYDVPDPVTPGTTTSSTTRITTETTRVTETATRTTSDTSRGTGTTTSTSSSGSSSNSVEDTRTRQLVPTDTLPTTSLPTSTPGAASDATDGAEQPEESSDTAAVPIAPIVGGVVGGLAFFVLVAAIFFLRRRRKQRASLDPSVAPYSDFADSTTQFRDRSPGLSAQHTPLSGSSFGNAGVAMEQTHHGDGNGYWNTFNPTQGPTYQASETSASTMPLAPLRRQITPHSNTNNSGSGQYSNLASGMGSGSDRTPSEPAVIPSNSSATADATLPYLQDSKPAYLYEGSVSSRRPYSISNPTPQVPGEPAPPVPPLPLPLPTHDSSTENELLRQQVDLLQAEIGQLRGRDVETSLLPPSYRDAVA